ncbi:MAG: AAA family ATPase [Planctomycetes bacterium]|nr:AAA family ATPase [Planctomycetota bacterium]
MAGGASTARTARHRHPTTHVFLTNPERNHTMKIVQLTAENVKKLKVVDITPTKDFIQITGKNGSGKTSVLDSISWALGGKDGIQWKPIREGAEKARIRLNLGDVIVERRFTQNGTSLTVENADGARYPSPQAMLDELIGELSFDPLAFAHMDPRKQYDELKRVAKIGVDIEDLEAKSKADFEKRTVKNREAKEVKARAGGYEFKFAADVEQVDVSGLIGKLQTAAQHNADIDRRAERRADTVSLIEDGKKDIAELEVKLAKMREHVAGMEKQVATAEALPKKVNVDELRNLIEEGQQKNVEHERRREQRKLLEQSAAFEGEAEALTKAIAERDAAKAKALQESKMPVPGLSLSDGRVHFGGVPFNQCSSAEQLRTSVAIAMAANPKLRVIRIKDGSLLDDDGLKLIAEQAKENDYQIWIERVDTSGKIGIVMEDGEVARDNETSTAA